MRPHAASDFERYRGLGKKDWENATISGLLLRLGLSGYQIMPHERPDALVDFSEADGSVRLGCEMQALHSDEGPSGSELRQFQSRWFQLMNAVTEELRRESVPVPYCTVWFRAPSYSCLRDIPNHKLISEFVQAARLLRSTPKIVFPYPDLPTLSSILREIRVVDSDNQGLLWWPAHFASGEHPPLDGAIVDAVDAKNKLAATFDWEGANERLLLLVAQGRGLTDMMGGAREIELPPCSAFSFTWVLIWDRFSEDIWTIFPHHAIICDGNEQLRWPQLLPLKLRRFGTRGERYPTRPKLR